MNRATTVPRARTRWPPAGHPRRSLLLAGLLGSAGSLLPWLWTPVGSLSGTAGPGLWTLCAATLAIAGGLMHRPHLAGGHATLAAVVLLALPAWQVARVLARVGFSGWMPGVGMVLVMTAGALAARAAVQLLGSPGRDF